MILEVERLLGGDGVLWKLRWSCFWISEMEIGDVYSWSKGIMFAIKLVLFDERSAEEERKRTVERGDG